MKIKKIFFWIFIVSLLAIDWAAIHDIIKGEEPSLKNEYATLILSAFILISIGIYFYLKKNNKNRIISAVHNVFIKL
jgi:drug/metabolite transporter (DMT)-like permease